MLRIQFTVEDLASTRLVPEPAPILETKLAAIGLHRGIGAPWGERWRHRALTAFPRSAEPLRELVPGFALTVSPSSLVDDFDAWREASASLGPHHRQAEMRLWYGSGGVPPLIRSGSQGDLDAERVFLRAMRSAFTAVVKPYWDDVRANHHAELIRQGRLIASQGIGSMLTTAIAGSRWCGDWLLIDTPYERTVRLGGRGLALTPVAFWSGPPLIGGFPDRPVVLAYAAPATLSIRVGSQSDPLAAILGSTRAAVLRLLATDHTTGDVARDLGVSAATASEHTSALRAARLITSRRDGKTVVHRVAELGRELIEVNR
ncbi:ArsR/SmtB family transcription factor [Microlunatus soli]|uniref:Helix-turn-helix domain-containing protein n=1 Tax=Microlunatus soli TaxID=630515 RepID=A0A1H1UQ73_9ACTN|nr:helix-turn-helix domain-containing protein [Microlunatus soli]SDS74430.1 Helix-turn-helix domain-containing protein [Microlunatus soli]